MAMVAPTVELAQYYAYVDSQVYVYAFNHHKMPDPAIYQARGPTGSTRNAITAIETKSWVSS